MTAEIGRLDGHGWREAEPNRSYALTRDDLTP
jgi:hypothetical protein